MSRKQAGGGFMAMIEVRVQANWFELETRTRRDYTKQLKEIVTRYEDVKFRWFDAEAWTGRFTDFILCEFEDLDSYNSLWGELRRHPFLSTPYAHISRVILGMELCMSSLVTVPQKELTQEETEPSPPVAEPLTPEAEPLTPEAEATTSEPVASEAAEATTSEPMAAEVAEATLPEPVTSEAVETTTPESVTSEVVETPTSARRSAASPLLCSGCGHKLKSSTKFCSRCGAKVVQVPVQA